MHYYQDLITIFNQCFTSEFNTLLIKGEDEPLYLPADEHRPHHGIYFAHGFFSSALHECAHWMIAGPERRQLVDFGYWYVPDGRTIEQQALFQHVEVKPQAMEWIFSKACNHPFRLSIDNLNGAETDTQAFKEAVHSQVLYYCQKGLPERADKFRKALCSFYNQPLPLNEEDFDLILLS